MPPLVWNALLREFGDDFEIQLAKLPGYAEPKQVPAGPPLDSLAELLAQAPERSHWCGWSLGATLAMKAALEFPERISKLTLISPTPRFFETDDWPHGISASVFDRLLRITQKKYAAGLMSFLQMQLPGETNQQLVDQLSQQIHDIRPTNEALQTGYATLRDSDLRDQLTEIAVPTQVIAANEDNIISPAASRFCAKQIPNTIFVSLGSNHCLPVTQPKKLAELISSFTNDDTIDRAKVARQFSQAAATYDGVAQMQRELGQALIDQIEPTATGTLVDLGCGTGKALEQINTRCPELNLIGIDIAPAMIQKSSERIPAAKSLVADIEQTGLPDATANYVISCAAMQWCRPNNAIAEVARLLVPGGQLLISTFVSGSLPEFREAWRRVSPALKRVHNLADAANWEQALAENGFEITEFNQHQRCQTFTSVDELLLRFRQLGAGYAGRDRTPLSREDYTDFRQQLGDLLGAAPKLTFECLTIIACKPNR